MGMSYFELEDDLYVDGRWYLNKLIDDTGIELDAREFRYGVPVDVGPPLKAFLWNEDKIIETKPPLRVLLDPKRKGMPLDFTYTNSDMPVVTLEVAEVLMAVASADIQRIPVCVESQEERYEIINVISRANCIDKTRSEIEYWSEGNDVRPDKAGMPRMVTELVIDPARTGRHHIFRLEGWAIALIVSEVVKNALEDAGVSGIKFRQVSP